MTDLSAAIAKQQEGRAVAPGPASVEAALEAMRFEFQKVLPTFLPTDTFLRLALNELRASPTLARCTIPSFMGALMMGARLGLEPGGPLGQLYLTPRNLQVAGADRGVKAWQVVPIIGYRGLRDLAIRSGKVDSIQSFLIREGDTFRYGSNEERGAWHDWIPADSDEDESDRPWTGVLTVAQLGVAKKPVWRYLSKKAVLARKAAGAAGDRGPWKEHEEAMVRKTGIRAIANDLPSSSVLIEAVRNDERVMVWRQGDTAPQQQQQIESSTDASDAAPSTPDVPDEVPERPDNPDAAPDVPEASDEVRRRTPRRTTKERYAPPPPGAPRMDDIPVEDPPEDAS